MQAREGVDPVPLLGKKREAGTRMQAREGALARSGVGGRQGLEIGCRRGKAPYCQGCSGSGMFAVNSARAGVEKNTRMIFSGSGFSGSQAERVRHAMRAALSVGKR